MISSVAAVLCWYDIRISCCLASSREKTMTLTGSPISSLLSNLRTSTWPSEPVPPVIKMRLPSKGFMLSYSPRLRFPKTLLDSAAVELGPEGTRVHTQMIAWTRQDTRHYPSPRTSASIAEIYPAHSMECRRQRLPPQDSAKESCR